MPNEYDNIIDFAPTAKPRQQFAPVNEYDDLIDTTSVARERAAAAQVKPQPEQAAQAINLAPKVGMPASVIGADLETYQQAERGQQAARAIERNGWISDYIARNPEAADVSSGDYDNLERHSQSMQSLDPISILKSGWETFKRIHPSLTNVGSAAVEGAKAGFGPEPVGLDPKEYPLSYALWQPTFYAPVDAALRGMKAAIFGAAGAGGQFLEEAGASPAWAARGTRDIRAIIEMAGAVVPEGIAQAGKYRRATMSEIEAFIGKAKGFESRAELDAWLKRQDEMSKLKTVLRIEHVKADQAAMDTAVQTMNETNTKPLSPTMAERFNEIHPNEPVQLPAQAIADMYRAEGKVPAEGDGLFGFVPDLARDLPLALETGTEITVPASKYIAHVDPAVHDKIKDLIRFRPDGVTVEEAKTLPTNLDSRAVEFETAKGSIYQVHEDATTTRNKAFRPEHGEAEQGIQPRSEKTVYVDEADIGRFAAPAETSWRVADHGDGTFSLITKNADGRWGVSPESKNIKTYNEPAVGRIPIELWKKEALTGYGMNAYAKMHPGNKIVRLSENGRDISNLDSNGIAAIREAETAAQDLGLKPLFEQAMAEKAAQAPKAEAKPPAQTGPEGSPRALFERAPPGMTAAEFDRYNRRIAETQEAVLESATKMVERAKDAKLTKEWKAKEAEVSQEVAQELNNRPDIAAERWVKGGKIKLDQAAIKAALGPDTDAIPAVMKAEGGVHPDDIAPFVGFSSGARMVKALNELALARKATGESPTKQFEQMVREATASRMETEHGDFGRQIAEEARALALDNKHFDILTDEMRILAQETGGTPPLTKEGIKEWAADQFAALPTKQAGNYKGFESAAGRAGKAAEQALLKGDFVEAFKAKQIQVKAWLLAKESNRFLKEADKTASKVDRVMGSKEIASIDQEYFDQLRSMLASVGFTPKHPIPEGLASLKDFVEASNGQAQVASWLQDGSVRVTDPSKLTVQQTRDLADSITSMMHVGRQEKTLTSAYKTAEIQNVMADIKQELDRFNLIDQPLQGNKTLGQRVGSLIRRINAAHVLPELIMDYIDKFNPEGPFSQFIDRPLRASNVKEIELTEKTVRKLKELARLTDVSIMDEIPNNLIIDPITGAPLGLVRRNLRQLMGYMGSKSGIDKVTGGFGVKADDVWALINEHATKADWQWVAGMHEIYKDLYAESKEMYLRDTGVAPDEVRALPMKSEKYGDFPGGYWPVKHDKTRGTIEQHVFAKTGPFGPDYTPALPGNSYTKGRTGYQDFLDLTGFAHDTQIRAIIHDVAFRESIRNAHKLFSMKPVEINGEKVSFAQEMTKKWGKEYAEVFPKWLEDIANSVKYDDAYAQGWGRASAFFRQNLTSAMTWMNPTTIEKHGISAAAMSVSVAGKEVFPQFVKLSFDGMIDYAKKLVGKNAPELTPDMIQAIKDITDPGERGESVRQFIIDSSAVIRTRQMRFQDSIKGAYEPSVYSPSNMLLWDARQMSFNMGRFPISFVDALSAYPTWYVAYKDAIMRSGGDKAQAVYEADKAMSRAHGSSSILDRSELMRSGELMRWFTGFFGFWNHNTNLRMRIAWDMAGMKQGRDEPGATTGGIANRMFWSILIPLIAEEVATGAMDEDHRGWGWKAFDASLRFIGGGYVGIREITNAVAHGREPSVGMLSSIAKTLNDAYNDISRDISGKSLGPKAMMHKFMAGAALTGYGGIESARIISFLTDRSKGREGPIKSWDELDQVLKTGRTKPRVHK